MSIIFYPPEVGYGVQKIVYCTSYYSFFHYFCCEEIEKHLRHLQNMGYPGSCAMDWGLGGFTNHKLTGVGSSSGSSPHILVISVTSAEAREMPKQVMNGERTQ